MIKNIENYLKAAQRGSEWLASKQQEDGSITTAEVYYKAPYALSVTGRTLEANKLINWIKTDVLQDNGDLNHNIYKNSWIVQGAHRLARFDVSLKGMDYILQAQAPCGGFCATNDISQIVEPIYTAWGGLCAVYTGHIDKACKAGNCFIEMVRQQPDEMKFYYNMTADGNLLTNSGFVDATKPKQIYYNPGIAMIFLMRLYLATANEKYLSTASEIFEFTLRCASDAYKTPPSGKSGLGCALLHDITGDVRARDKAIELADYLVKIQHPDGAWGFSLNDAFETLVDITAEFTVFTTEITAILANAKK
jgi:hypothetical protein